MYRKYRAKCPKHILIADEAYFQKEGSISEKCEIIEYRPPSEFALGITFNREVDPDTLEHSDTIVLYFLPEQNLDDCLRDEYISGQYLLDRTIETYTGDYRIVVDGRQRSLKVGGHIGRYQEFRNHNENGIQVLGVMITMVIPDRKLAIEILSSLFEEVQAVPYKALENQTVKKETDRVEKADITHETIREPWNAGSIEGAQQNKAVMCNDRKKKQKRKKYQMQYLEW